MKEKIVIYREPNGTVNPVSISYGEFFIGADTIAVFTLDDQIKQAIQKIKSKKFQWTKISQDGQFHIVSKDQTKFPIVVGKSGSVSHGYKGKISRGDISSINGMDIGAWVQQLRSKKQLSIA